MSVKLTNIKVSVNCIGESLYSVCDKLRKSFIRHKIYNNFVVVKDRFVYTIFRQSKNSENHINITKIKKIEEIEDSIEIIEGFGFNIIKKSIKIDNITGSLDIGKEIFIKDLIESVKKSELSKDILISYSNEKFPGIFLKVKKLDQKIGTIIAFHSGKIVFVGCKNIQSLKCLESLTFALTGTS